MSDNTWVVTSAVFVYGFCVVPFLWLLLPRSWRDWLGRSCRALLAKWRRRPVELDSPVTDPPLPGPLVPGLLVPGPVALSGTVGRVFWVTEPSSLVGRSSSWRAFELALDSGETIRVESPRGDGSDFFMIREPAIASGLKVSLAGELREVPGVSMPSGYRDPVACTWVVVPPDESFGTIDVPPAGRRAYLADPHRWSQLKVIMFALFILHGTIFLGYHVRVVCGKPIQAVVQTSYQEQDWSSKSHQMNHMITALLPDGSVTDGLEVDRTMTVGAPVTLLVVNGAPDMTDVGDQPTTSLTRSIFAFFIVLMAFSAAKGIEG